MSRIKHPRTPHVSWSPGASSDDIVLSVCDHFDGKMIVMSEKLDGEATTIYPDGYVHARSTDSAHHPSRSWVKQLAAQIAHQIPDNWRISGENLFAHHSIFYTNLPSYFFVYGIYDESNTCLAWDQTELICEMLGLTPVPVIYKGKWDAELIQGLWNGKGRFPTFETEKIPAVYPEDFQPCEAEGYVIRLADAFAYDDFANSVAKWVRPQHVKTDEHWMQRKPFPNLLKLS